MYNFFNFKKINDDTVLLTNDFGDYAFIGTKDFDLLINNPQLLDDETSKMLKEKRMIINGSEKRFIDDNYFFLRDSKNYLFQPTSLHIFVVTNSCNLNCIYCQANDGTKLNDYMSKETAKRAVDFAMQSPAKELTFEFQGGEPLLNFETIKFIVEYSSSIKPTDRIIHYSIVSNITLINQEIADFIKAYDISLSTSLDGDENVHNNNRPFFSTKRGSYSLVVEKLEMLRDKGISVGAIQTTTRFSLSHPKRIIDAYLNLGFDNIFIRPLSPLGCAKEKWDAIGYTPEEFVGFYKQCLLYILSQNINGISMKENYASIIFSKLLNQYPVNYMELRSPCGGVLGQLAYYTNGDVFTCDEGRMMYEMGNDMFKLGSVYSSSYHDLVKSRSCHAMCAASALETIPSCCDCVYQPYCGTCPVINYSMHRDVVAKIPNDYKCRINKGVFSFLFELLYKNDSTVNGIISHWRA